MDQKIRHPVKVARRHWPGFLLACLAILVFWGMSSQALAASIINSKHNLSVSGPGTVKALNENEVCIFCHAPHNASGLAPLWNRYESGQMYTPYQSSTAKATVDQPSGASKLCLSCHDGTVALGMVRSRLTEIDFGATNLMPAGSTNLQTDLSDDHPISFNYDVSLTSINPQLKDPSTLINAVRLDKNGQLQCTSCHDPHNNENGDFLAMDAIGGNLCMQCHNKTGWTFSLHKTSLKTWNGISTDPWPHTSWNNVSDNGCENCHRPHSAGGKIRLLNYATEEQNCLSCHNGNVASKNIAGELNKLSVHPVGNTTGAHDEAEPALMGSSRHVECADCHNPHAVNDQDGPNLPGSLQLVKGMDALGRSITQINYEYELCFRCHSDSPGSTVYVNRQFPEMNTRLQFDPANASYHPVENTGRNPDVPSLISPYTTSSIIRCTSCHNNNSGPGTSGTGPNGPHGSIYRPLLERQLLMNDGLSESSATYALCYKCHDRNSILDDRSFPDHKKHIEDKNTPCTACHDPHGVKSVPHLINFDRNIVSPDAQGRLLFQDLGRFRGQCYLNCHGEEHDPKTY